MNLRNASSTLRAFAFRIARMAATSLPACRIQAFGSGTNKIGAILVINLNRQPKRLRLVLRELNRFRTADGLSLVSITRRLGAIDARDGRSVAATADVDSTYHIADHLFVQPDARLEACFNVNEPIKMTRQEIAVARSHVEAWKTIAAGSDSHVLVIEDDVWFKGGAADLIDRGWSAAQSRRQVEGGPQLLYLSYADAGGTAERSDICEALFRPVRGLWFLSGYVLSREGAAALLRAMPVVGPVDLWINYRFVELDVLALAAPAILQREDTGSDNSYSILPYLARAGIVDAGSAPMRPPGGRPGLVLAWAAGNDHESLAMALSMLGLRVRVFDPDEGPLETKDLADLGEIFDALVDASLAPSTLAAAITRTDTKFLIEGEAADRYAVKQHQLTNSRIKILSNNISDIDSWKPICELLGLAEPTQEFPVGAPRSFRMFRDDRPGDARRLLAPTGTGSFQLDDSPWVLPQRSGWQPRLPTNRHMPQPGDVIATAIMKTAAPSFMPLIETFPGNLASFMQEGLEQEADGTRLTLSKDGKGTKPYRSGAFASVGFFGHGRFEAEIRAAPGSGLITGFFLHRDLPRQEIDVELPGADPRCMLVNVYFNPGDDGTAMSYGYRGAPCRINLGFDTTQDFHLYAIDWRPGCIVWSVDGKTVHERMGWDPTPLPHLPMRLHANLWAPRSIELAGQIHEAALPAAAKFRNVLVRA